MLSPYLHWVRSNDGFPTSDDKAKCPQCKKDIKYEWFFSNKKARMVKRDNYYRLFKDDNTLNITKQKKIGNFITIDSFWDDYVYEELKKEKKGIIMSNSEKHFLKDNKYIRGLSQIGYRLLNFILFSNLLFSSALGNILKGQLKLYCAEMSCIKMLETNWIKLEKELFKKGINNIEIFMNMIFKDITDLLCQIQSIHSFTDLITMEKKVENLIKLKISNYNQYKEKYRSYNDKYKKGDICSIDSLLSENNDWSLYNEKKYPFLQYFYYTNLPNERLIKAYINNQKERFPVIYAYLNIKKAKINFLQFLPLYNKFHNLLLDLYSFRITRILSEKKIFKNEEIYLNNKVLCDCFIKVWNENNKQEQLNIDMPLKNFFIDNDNKHFINFYNLFIKIQNEIIEPLIEQKVQNGILKESDKEKVPIQKINENVWAGRFIHLSIKRYLF